MKTGFIYEWTDTKTGLKYIGKHEGHESDGYIGSGTIFIKEYNARPGDFVRKILWTGNNISSADLSLKEEEFLLKILDEELYYGSNKKYYNQVRNSSGYTSENNPMNNLAVVERMKETRKAKNLNDPWKNTVKKYGYEEACKMKSSSKIGNNYATINKGRPKSDEHKRKIAEAVKAKHADGNYYTKKPGRKKVKVDID